MVTVEVFEGLPTAKPTSQLVKDTSERVGQSGRALRGSRRTVRAPARASQPEASASEEDPQPSGSGADVSDQQDSQGDTQGDNARRQEEYNAFQQQAYEDHQEAVTTRQLFDLLSSLLTDVKHLVAESQESNTLLRMLTALSGAAGKGRNGTGGALAALGVDASLLEGTTFRTRMAEMLESTIMAVGMFGGIATYESVAAKAAPGNNTPEEAQMKFVDFDLCCTLVEKAMRGKRTELARRVREALKRFFGNDALGEDTPYSRRGLDGDKGKAMVEEYNYRKRKNDGSISRDPYCSKAFRRVLAYACLNINAPTSADIKRMTLAAPVVAYVEMAVETYLGGAKLGYNAEWQRKYKNLIADVKGRSSKFVSWEEEEL